MPIDIHNIYSFDDNCVLNLCEVKIPPAYRFLVKSKEKITSRHYQKLKLLLDGLEKNKVPPYKFVPKTDNFMRNLFEVTEELLDNNEINLLFLSDTFRKEVIDYLKSFYTNLTSFKDILKSNNIIHIKSNFVKNKQKLKKSSNPKYNDIPEDDDLSILSGLYEFKSISKPKGDTYVISGDEHFWGYKNLIQSDYQISVIEMWFCHKLI